jgi:L-malate glycosyltransferase
MDATAMSGPRPLRIAMMLESDGPGGAEVMNLRLSAELRRLGHEVVPVGPAHGQGWLGDHFRRGGFPTEVFQLNRPIDPSCVRGLVGLFARQRIDIVHSHEFTMSVYGTAATRIARLPHLLTMHGGLTVCRVLRRRIALRWAMRRSEHAVVVSRATLHQFSSDLGISPARLVVVPNGVPITLGDATRVRAEFGIRDGECVLLAVGTLERHKGHRVLLEALAALPADATRTPWRLVIAGGRGGDQHDSLLAFVREAGLAERVHIVTNRDDIADLQAMADVYVMPMALLEAMVAGKAIVASRTAGIPEAIDHDENGLLVPPGDVESLTAALRTVIGDASRRLNLGAAAAERARREFSVHVMASRYETLYRSAIAQRYGRRERIA